MVTQRRGGIDPLRQQRNHHNRDGGKRNRNAQTHRFTHHTSSNSAAWIRTIKQHERRANHQRKRKEKQRHRREAESEAASSKRRRNTKQQRAEQRGVEQRQCETAETCEVHDEQRERASDQRERRSFCERHRHPVGTRVTEQHRRNLRHALNATTLFKRASHACCNRSITDGASVECHRSLLREFKRNGVFRREIRFLQELRHGARKVL